MTAAIFKIPDLAVSDNYGKKSQMWNNFSKISNLPTFNDEIKKEKSGKNWEGNSTLNTNSSTLSLYITAHENSSEAVTFDSFHDNEKSLKNNKFGSIKRHEILDTSTFLIQNPFEFPRQQNYEVPEPEMCQYKASQRLINPNEASMIVQQAGTVTEIWMFFWLLIFVVSTGVIISITCNKGRQPPTSKKHQRQKNSNAESMKSKKNKDGKKGGENNKNNNVEKSRNTGSLKQQQPPSENVFQSSSQDKRESEAGMDSQQQKSEQASKKDESNKQATNTPYENWDPPRQGPQAENKGDEVEQKSEEKVPPDDAPQKNDNETDKASTKEPKKKKKKKHKKKKAAKDSDEEEDEASTKKEKKKKHKKKKKKKEKDNEDKDEEDENQSGKKKKSKKHKKKKVKKETDDEGEGEGGESETEIEPQNPAELQIPPGPQIPKEPQIPTEPQKPAEEIPALSVKLTKTKYENVGILQNPKKGKKPSKGDKHNPGLMTRYNNLLISGDEAEDGKELPSQLKRFVKPPLPKIEDQPSPLPSPVPVKMLSSAERMPRSLQLDKTQDQSKIITGIENEIVTGIPRSETQKAERMLKKNKLDKTQDHRYNKDNSPPMSLSTTQELPPVKATLQKTQTYFDVTQHDDGTTQKSLSKLSTAIEDEVFATGLQRTKTQESESTQTLAKVASLTPIETTQCSTLGETQLTTKATQQTQTAAPPSHKSVTEEPLKTATERDQLDKTGENQNNPPILISTKQAKKDASVKIKKVDEAEKKKLNVEAEREAKKAAEGERLRKLRENAPKPKVLKRNSWEEKVAGGKVFRRKHEYPTMNDVVSDWESEESSENPRKDQPPDPKIVFPNVTPKAGSSSSSTSPN